MANILRNPSRQRYTVIDNKAIQDERLSLKALGLLVRMLSLPDNWEFSEMGLKKIFKKDGMSSIRTGLKELEDTGYLKRERKRDELGRITRTEWIICESPDSIPNLENPSMESHIQQNTNNTYSLKDKIRNNDNASPGGDVDAFISIYFNEYRLRMGKEHPRLKGHQMQKVRAVLQDYAYLDYKDMQDMVDSYFDEVRDTDYNINHFATEGILMNRLYHCGLA